MDTYLTSTFIIPFLFAAGFAIWFFVIRKKQKTPVVKDQQSATKLKVLEPLDVMLYDRTTYPFTRYETTLQKDVIDAIMSKHGTLGRQLAYGTKKLVCYFKGFVNDEIVYEPVFEPQTAEDSPKELFIDTRHYYAEITERTKTEKGFLQKHGSLLIFIFGLAFLAFMIVSNK
jgi:hypothetical protein